MISWLQVIRLIWPISHRTLFVFLADHNFELCKVDIERVIVLDYYGGPHTVSVEEYYKANFDWKLPPIIQIDENDVTTSDEFEESEEGAESKYVYIKIEKDSKVKVIHVQV